MQTRNICVIIPAYNEERSLHELLSSLKTFVPVGDIIVIDDGSTDQTARVVEKEGAVCIRLPRNCGSGVAIRNGLSYALKKTYHQAVILDADGQHDPADIPVLLAALTHNTDMVIGSRYTSPMPWQKKYVFRRLGTLVISTCMRLLYRKVIHDPTSGFRVCNARAMRFLVNYYATPFPEPETLIKMLQYGFRVGEVPIVMKQRRYGASSITRVRGFSLMVYIVIAMVLGRIRTSWGFT